MRPLMWGVQLFQLEAFDGRLLSLIQASDIRALGTEIRFPPRGYESKPIVVLGTPLILDYPLR